MSSFSRCCCYRRGCCHTRSFLLSPFPLSFSSLLIRLIPPSFLHSPQPPLLSPFNTSRLLHGKRSGLFQEWPHVTIGKRKKSRLAFTFHAPFLLMELIDNLSLPGHFTVIGRRSSTQTWRLQRWYQVNNRYYQPHASLASFNTATISYPDGTETTTRRNGPFFFYHHGGFLLFIQCNNLIERGSTVITKRANRARSLLCSSPSPFARAVIAASININSFDILLLGINQQLKLSPEDLFSSVI